MRVKSGKKLAPKASAKVLGGSLKGEGKVLVKGAKVAGTGAGGVGGANSNLGGANGANSNLAVAGVAGASAAGVVGAFGRGAVAAVGLAAVALSGASAAAWNDSASCNITAVGDAFNVSCTGSTIDGNIYGANGSNWSSSNNNITLSNVTTQANASGGDGTVWGGNFSRANASGDSVNNSVNITGGTISGSVIGGASVNGTNTHFNATTTMEGASSNNVTIRGTDSAYAVVKSGVFGGVGAGTTAANNNYVKLSRVNVSGETPTTNFGYVPVLGGNITIEVGGTVLGGVTYGVAPVANNTVEISDSWINASVIGGGTVNGRIINNTVNISNTHIGGNVYGGFNINATGAVDNVSGNITWDASSNNTVGVYELNVTGLDGNVSKVNITVMKGVNYFDENMTAVTGVNISGSRLYTFATARSEGYGNKVVLSDVNVTGGESYKLLSYQFDTEGNVFGAIAGLEGAHENSVEITGSNISGSLINGTVMGGGSYYGNVVNNTVDIHGVSVNGKSTGYAGNESNYSVVVNNAIFGGIGMDVGKGNTSVFGNVVNISHVNVTGLTKNTTFASGLKFETAGVVAGGLNYGSSKNVTNNTVIGDHVWIGGTVIGGGSSGGQAANNTVNLTNSVVQGSIYGSYNINASGLTSVPNVPIPLIAGDSSSSDNSIVYLKNVTTIGNISHTLLGNVIVSEGNVWGGYAGRGGATGNSVTIIDSNIGGSVFGSGSFYGQANGNSLNVTNTTVKGGLFGSVSYGNYQTQGFEDSVLYLDGVNVTGDTQYFTMVHANITNQSQNPYRIQIGGMVGGIINYGGSAIVGNTFNANNSSLVDNKWLGYDGTTNVSVGNYLLNQTGAEHNILNISSDIFVIQNSKINGSYIAAGSLNGTIENVASVIKNTTIGGNIYGAYNIAPLGEVGQSQGAPGVPNASISLAHVNFVDAIAVNFVAASGITVGQSNANVQFNFLNYNLTMQGNVIGAFGKYRTFLNGVVINDTFSGQSSTIHGSVVGAVSYGNASYNNLVEVTGVNESALTTIHGAVLGSVTNANEGENTTAFAGLYNHNLLSALENKVFYSLSTLVYEPNGSNVSDKWYQPYSNGTVIRNSTATGGGYPFYFDNLVQYGTQVNLKNVNVTGQRDNINFGRNSTGEYDAGGAVIGVVVNGTLSIAGGRVNTENVWAAGSIIGGLGQGNVGDIEANLTNVSWLAYEYSTFNTSDIVSIYKPTQLGMFVNLKNTTSGGNVRGALSFGGNALAYVNLTDVNVTGGSTLGFGGASFNTSGDVIGAQSFGGNVRANVSIAATTAGTREDPNITSSYIAGSVIGGKTNGSGNASNNNVTIENVTVNGMVVGGWADGNGSASGNSVTIKNSIVKANNSGIELDHSGSNVALADVAVIGGYSKDGLAQNNVVNIVNSTIYGHICVGYQETQQYGANSDGNNTAGLSDTTTKYVNVSQNGSVAYDTIKVSGSTLIGGSFLRVCGNVDSAWAYNNKDYVNVIIDNSIIRDKNITNESINNSTIIDSNISGNNNTINDSNISHSNITDSNISDNNITDSNISDSNVSQSNISDSNISGGNTCDSNVSGGNLNNGDYCRDNVSDANVSGSNVTDSNVTDSNVTNSTVEDSNVSGSNVTESNVSRSNITDSNVTDSNVSFSNISDSNISGGNTCDSNISGGNLNNGDYCRDNVSDANVSGSNVTDSNVTDSNVTNSTVEDSNVSRSNITDSNVSRSNITDSNVSNSTVEDSNISFSNVTDTNISGGNTCDSNISGGNIENAYLCRDNITDANVSQSNITDSNVTDNNLTDVDINRSNVTDNNISDSYINNSNLSNNNVSNVTIENSNFSNGSVDDANVSGGRICDANITGDNFYNVDLCRDNISNSNVTDDSNITDSNVTATNITDSEVYDSNVNNSNISASEVYDSNISNSSINDSNIIGGNVNVSNVSGGSLCDANINGSNLNHVYLCRDNISESNITNASTVGDSNVTNSDIKDSNVTGSNVTGGNITESEVKDSNITNATIKDSNITGGNVNVSDVSGGSLCDVNINGSNIDSAYLCRDNISESDVTKSEIDDSNITNGSVITDSNISRSNVSNSNLTNTNVSGGKVQDSTINESDVKDAEIIGGNITGSNVSGGNITGSTVTGTDKGRNLCDIDIYSANLNNVYLCRDNITDSVIDNGSYVNDSNLINSTVQNAHVNASNITGGALKDNANVSNSTLDSMNIIGKNENGNDYNINITDSNITNSNVSDITLEKLNFTDSNISASNIADSNITGGILNGSGSDFKNNTIKNATLNDFIINDTFNNSVTNSVINNSQITAPKEHSLDGNNITNSNIDGLVASNVLINVNASGEVVEKVDINNLTLTNGAVCNANTLTKSNIANSLVCNSTVSETNITMSRVLDSNVSNSNLTSNLYQNVIIDTSNVTGMINESGDAIVPNVSLGGTVITNSNVTVAKASGNAIANITLTDGINISNSNVILVEARDGDANATISIDGDVHFDNGITGAISENGNANLVLNASGSSGSGEINGDITGAIAKNNGNATANIAAVGATVRGDIIGAQSNGGTANATIDATDATVGGNITGAVTSNGHAWANITANGAQGVQKVIGAQTDTGDAIAFINATKANINGDITGALVTAGGDATGNIHLIESNVSGNVIGAQTPKDGKVSGTVRLDGASVGGFVAGAYAIDGDANDSVVTFGEPNSTVNGNIYGGYGQLTMDGAKNPVYYASNNTVNISAPLNAPDSIVYGGYLQKEDGLSYYNENNGTIVTENNRLIIASKNVTVKDVKAFQFIDFYLPQDIVDGDTMLNLKGDGTAEHETDLLEINFAAFVRDGSIDALDADKLEDEITITLINKTSGTLKFSPGVNVDTYQSYNGLSVAYDHIFTTTHNASQLNLNIRRGVNTQQKAIYESALAGIAPIVRNHDVIHDMVYRMEPNGDLTSSDMMTGNIEAGRYKSYTGSHIINKNLGLAVGVGRNQNDEFYYGLFLDAGYGTYETYNNDAHRVVKGGGDTMHIGLGAFAKWLFGSNLDNSFYATIRAGYSKVDFWADRYNSATGVVTRVVNEGDMELARIYYGATIEGAHNLGSYWDDGRFEIFARASFVSATDDTAELPNETFTIETTNSLIARAGFRYTETLDESWTSYVSLAFEREFLGESKGNNERYGYALTDYMDAPSMKGNSGVGEIGLTYDNKNTGDGGFVVNVKLMGSVGTNRGWGGGLDIKYRF